MNAAQLTDTEADTLALLLTLDSGTLAERLAALAHTAAYHADITAGELRDLAALTLTLARRLDTTAAEAND